MQKEISKYIKDKSKLISIIKKYCEFFNFSEKDEYISYNLPNNMTVFSILNIPPKLKKEEVYKNLELINLQYNRLYKIGFYWNLCTTDKETIICVQNSLRTLTFDDMVPKYSLKNKAQIFELLKEQVDKISYQKESKNLGIGKNNKNSDKKLKDDDAMSWRKASSESGINYDNTEKRYKKNNYYYNNNYNYNYKKRKRFNSDNAISYNKQENYEEYKPYYKEVNKDIEIDISKIKYPPQIKYKYSFKDVHDILDKMKIPIDNPFSEKNKEIYFELVRDKPKALIPLEQLSKITTIKEIKEEKKEGEINTNIKIPKINPLSNMGKGNYQ